MSHVRFTGERLHEHAPSPGAAPADLFAVDLARHRAAYHHAAEHSRARARGSGARRERILDLGSGAGWGTAILGELDACVVGVDRELPDRPPGKRLVRFVRAEVERLPLRSRSFDLVTSFQVIEHLADPQPYLREIARVLFPEGSALLTTPDRATSDGLNPYHVREYLADELQALLAGFFAHVEVRGVGCSERVAPYFQSRRRTLARIERLDLLDLRRRLPRALRLWLFARGAVVVRRALRCGGTLVAATVDDFPIGPVGPSTLDLFAECARPRW